MTKDATIKEVLSGTAKKPEEAVKKNNSNKIIIIILILILLALTLLITLIGLNIANPTQNLDISPTVTLDPSINPTEEVDDTPTITDTVSPTTAPQVMRLKFYVFDSVKDPDVMICGAPSYVERNLPKSDTPLKDSINYLLHTLKLTVVEKNAGLVNNFENADYIDRLDGFNLLSANIVNKVGRLTFEDKEDYTSIGSCWSNMIYEQIEFTATQFPTVDSIVILPEGELFQP